MSFSLFQFLKTYNAQNQHEANDRLNGDPKKFEIESEQDENDKCLQAYPFVPMTPVALLEYPQLQESDGQNCQTPARDLASKVQVMEEQMR